MNNLFKKSENKEKELMMNYLIDEIIRIENRMTTMETTSKEYSELTRTLDVLYRNYGYLTEKKKETKISPDVIASGVFGLVGLVTVLHYEQLNVITSKAFNFVMNRLPHIRV